MGINRVPKLTQVKAAERPNLMIGRVLGAQRELRSWAQGDEPSQRGANQ
jgi:hypothetical protein